MLHRVGQILVALLIASGAAAQDRDGASLIGTFDKKQFVAGQTVRVQAAVDNDVFVAGGEVDVVQSSVTDVFAAGGDVRLEETTAQSAIVAGGSVEYRRLTVGELITAAGELDVDTQVTDDLIAAAGEMRLRPGTDVGGDALLVGGELVIDGNISGDLWARAGEIRLSGTIGGDASLAGGNIVIDPGARIGGDLVYRSKRLSQIPPDVVAGTTTREERQRTLPVQGPLGVWARIGIFAGLALAALVLYGVTPATLDGAVDILIGRPGTSFLAGLAVFIAVPVLTLLLAITIIGLPLSLFLGALYFAGFIPSYVTLATWIGGRLAHLAGQSPALWGARFIWLLVGLAALIALSAVPVIGPISSWAALVFGIGALTMQLATPGRAS